MAVPFPPAFQLYRQEQLGEVTVSVGFMAGEPTAVLYMAGKNEPPTCVLTLEQLGQVFALFNELESTA